MDGSDVAIPGEGRAGLNQNEKSDIDVSRVAVASRVLTAPSRGQGQSGVEANYRLDRVTARPLLAVLGEAARAASSLLPPWPRPWAAGLAARPLRVEAWACLQRLSSSRLSAAARAAENPADIVLLAGAVAQKSSAMVAMGGEVLAWTVLSGLDSDPTRASSRKRER